MQGWLWWALTLRLRRPAAGIPHGAFGLPGPIHGQAGRVWREGKDSGSRTQSTTVASGRGRVATENRGINEVVHGGSQVVGRL